MSDRVVQSYHGDGMAGKSMHPNRSAWMAHWMRTSSDSAPQAYNHVALHRESKEDVHGTPRHPFLSEPEIVPDVSESAKGFREVMEARTVKIVNESITMSSNSLGKKRLDCQPFPMFNLYRNRETILGSEHDQPAICHRQVVRSQVNHNSGHNTVAFGTTESHLSSVLVLAPPEVETSSRGHFQLKCISQNLELPVKSHKFLEKNSLDVPRSFPDDFGGSSSDSMPLGFPSKKIPIQPFMRRQENANQFNSMSASKKPYTNTTITHLEHENCNYHSYSAFLVCEKKMGNHPKSKTSGTSLFGQSDRGLSLHDPSISNSQLPASVGEQHQKLQNYSGSELFPSQSSPLEVTKSEKLYNGSNSLQKLPCTVHDVETMKLCATVDSVEGISGCHPKFSQATRSLFITEKTGNFSGGEVFRESSASTNIKENAFGGLLCSSPPFGFHGQRGLKLQPLDSSTDSEGKENSGHTKTAVDVQNESSAETDIMDMNAFQERDHLSGLALSLSNKEIMGGQNLQSSQAPVASAREEVGGRLPNTVLPDINEEPPALPAVARSTDDGEPSTSRTQSLNVEHLLSHAEQPMNSKSSPCPDGLLGPDPSSRWVKRLKMSASNSFAHGTKSSKMGEASSHEKVNKLFSQIMKCSSTSSEPRLGRGHGKDHVALDQTAVLLKKGESSSMDSVKKGSDIMLSRSWIQRWCHNRTASRQKKPEAVVICEPQSSKVAFDNIEKKQFPSIAAMALMGKAMSGFHPCEFRKRGSFVVWNTKGI